MYQTALTMKSRNVKTGPIPVSTTAETTCPTACPFQAAGCYAEAGPLALFWRKVTEAKAGAAWAEFLAQVRTIPEGSLWRHNQAGDLPGNRQTIDAPALAALADASQGRRGWTYTHYDVISDEGNRNAVRAANDAGFVVNLSGNTLAHADALAETGAGPVVVLPSTVQGRQTLQTPAGRKVVVCPATYRDDVSCASCGLCALQREAIVGFPAHGASKRKASTIATGA